MGKDKKPDKIEVRGARVHNLKNMRLSGLPEYPAPVKALLRWGCCMPKDRDVIWNLFLHTRAGG